ncbi:MAG: HAMP domain-containing histidine kinase [Deltaproteobacteria bacterium]|nr:HAMP domain-containing histidine kinase [Deltaproteobacteria bacterium]
MSDTRDPAHDGAIQEEATLLVPALLHELRHPLMGIKGGLELVARHAGSAVSKSPEWDLVVQQVARLEELLASYDELLSPGKAHPGAFRVDEVVRRALELLAFRLRRLGPRFSYETAQGQPWGWGTPNALLHAVTNLMHNANDAIDEAGGVGRLHLRVSTLDTRVEVRLSDEGTGIHDDARARLFTPRFTTKVPGKGTGLGLHIARTMMRSQGGEVRLVAQDDPQRVPWARTEFVIEVPSQAPR